MITAQDERRVNAAVQDVIESIPKGTRVYLVGGRARTRVYARVFHKRLPNRDWDIVVIGDRKRFIANLLARGFSYGLIRRKHQDTIAKPLVRKPRGLREHPTDYFVLDAKFQKRGSAMANLKANANFTINGFAIPFHLLNSPSWYAKTIQLPTALADLKAKRLRVNHNVHPNGLFAAIRFMSLGFKPPNTHDVHVLREWHLKFEQWRFAKNVKKVYAYVGGRAKALQLAKRLGLHWDIFSYPALLQHRTQP